MGRPMSGHMVNAGFEVTIYDPSAEAVEGAVASGCSAAGSAREVAERSDITYVMPGFFDEVEAALLTDDGVLAGESAGDVVVVASTVTPEQAKTLAAECSARDVHFVDAPVCQGERGAEEAYLVWLVGGDADVVERVRPSMTPCGDDIFHLGPVGAGMVGKALNNMLLWAALVADHEALRLGELHGVTSDVLIPALLRSSGTNWPLAHWADMHRIPWAHKDMQIILEMGDRAELTLPIAGLLREQVKPLMAAAGIDSSLIR